MIALPKMNKEELMVEMINTPALIYRAMFRKSFYEFFKYFWGVISPETLVDNWHIKYLCDELQVVNARVVNRQPKLYDVIINIPPGTSKTSIVSVMYPVWCWTMDFTQRFITAGYSSSLSLESAELARELIRSQEFQTIYPELAIKADKDTKTNYKVIKRETENKGGLTREVAGGNRFSTSVGGTLTGFHGHQLIVDDPLNPHEAQSKQIIHTTNNWIDQVLSTRKVDKEVSVTIIIMQRINQKDPTGHLLSKGKKNIKHICLPAELGEYAKDVKPQELVKYYTNGLLDPVRLNANILKESRADLGQYGYAGQMGQRPTPPGGGMFQVSKFHVVDRAPEMVNIEKVIRYWDKAGTADAGAYTAGVKIAKIKTGGFIILDVKRGQWGTHERERVIKATAVTDGTGVEIYIEQEPGSGGKESAESTVINLIGFTVHKDRPVGDKVFRADPYSVQVNEGMVQLLNAMWNHEFIEEHRFFPFSQYKDQVDAAGGGFSKLTGKRMARSW